ncbi:MAG: VCBS repeat-containing protein [Acidobacteriota bacterium]
MSRRTSRSCLVGLILCAFALPAAAVIELRGRNEISIGSFTDPVAVVAGDFVNSDSMPAGMDGVLDLAVLVDTPGPAIIIFENQGDGSFTEHVVLEPDDMAPRDESRVGDRPTAIRAVDLDGDTFVDDLVGTNEDSARFFSYINAMGAWTFSDPSAGQGDGASIALFDWNEDMLVDLFFCTGSEVKTAGQGAPGSFAFVTVFPAATAGVNVRLLVDIEVGDFVDIDTAGQPDLLTVDSAGMQLVVWPGQPLFGISNDLLVAKPVAPAGYPMQTPVEAIAGEFTGDMRLDALVATEQGLVLLYPGNGDPTMEAFDDPIVFDVAAPLATEREDTRLSAMILADVVGETGVGSAPDGVDDLVLTDAGDVVTAGQGHNWVWIVPGRAGATLDFNIDAQFHHAQPDLAPRRPGGVTAADLAGDGSLDLVVAASDGNSLTLLTNDGTGRFDAPRSFASGLKGPTALAVNRQSVSAAADLVIGSGGDGSLGLLPGAGDGSFGQSSGIAPGAPGGVRELLVDLFDGDARPDLLVGTVSDHALHPGRLGGFDPGVALGISGTSRPAGLPATPGALDLVVVNDAITPELEIWHGDGMGGFTMADIVGGFNLPQDHLWMPDLGTGTVVVAGKDSAAPGAGRPQLFLYTDDGSGWALTDMLSLPDPFNESFVTIDSLRIGDFDGDMRADDLAVLERSGSLLVYLESGGSLGMPVVNVGVSPGPRDIVVADLSGDGIDDLAVANANRLTLLESLGDGMVAAPLRLGTNLDNLGLVATDLDGDLLPDVALLSGATNDVTVFLNVGTPPPPPFRLQVDRDEPDDVVSWTDVGAAVYTLLRGDLGLLRTTSDLTMTDPGCLIVSMPVNLRIEIDASPPEQALPGGGRAQGYWYLARCEGMACSDDTFGSDTDFNTRFPAGCP